MTPSEREQDRRTARGEAGSPAGAELSPCRLAWTDPDTRERLVVEVSCTGSFVAALEVAGFERITSGDIEPGIEPSIEPSVAEPTA